MSRAIRCTLHRYSVQELRDELDRRRTQEGKAPHQWDEARTTYLKRLIAEYQASLDQVLEDYVPGGGALAIKQARVRSLKDKIKKYEAWLVMAEADETKVAAARKRG